MTKRTSKTIESKRGKQVELIEDDLEQVAGGASGVLGYSVSGGGVPGSSLTLEPAFEVEGGGVPGKPVYDFAFKI